MSDKTGLRCTTFLMTKGACRVGTDTPECFNTIMFYALGSKVDALTAEGRGFTIDGSGAVLILVWADNVYLITDSICNLNRQLEVLTVGLNDCKLSWKHKESCYVMNKWAQDKEIREHGQINNVCVNGNTVPRVDTFVALGILIDPDGGSDAVVQHRVAEGNKHWGARRKQLCNKRSPLALRGD